MMNTMKMVLKQVVTKPGGSMVVGRGATSKEALAEPMMTTIRHFADLLDIKRLLFLHERNLYFGRCYLLKNFGPNTQFFFTVKEATERKFEDKYKIEGKHNLKTIRAYKNDTKIEIRFDVDPLDEGNIKLKTTAEKFDKIFHVNAIKERLNMKELFGVCALLLKDDGELYILLNNTQYVSLKIDDDAKAAGICLKEKKEVKNDYFGSFSLTHVKAAKDTVFYVFQLSPTPKAGGNDDALAATQNATVPVVIHPQPGEDAAGTGRHAHCYDGENESAPGLKMITNIFASPLRSQGSNVDMLDGVAVVRSEKVKDELVSKGNDSELDSRSCAVIHQASNVDMLDGVAVVKSEKVKDELISKGNDSELDSRSCAVIHQVRKVNLLDAEKVKDQPVLDGNDIGKD